MTTEDAGSQDMPLQRIPDYSHLAPKLNGNERLDVAVSVVAQAASAAAAAAAAAVISAAGEQIRAHMQVQQLPTLFHTETRPVCQCTLLHALRVWYTC